MSGSFSIPASLIEPPRFTTTKVPDVEPIFRLPPADVDCLRRLTPGRDLLTFWPLLRNFGESNREFKWK